MAKKKDISTEEPRSISLGCCNCKIDAMLSVDERGQMVLPKDLREKAGIKAGDKLAAISWEQKGQTACIVLIKADNLAEMVKGFLGPVFENLFRK